MTRYIEERNRKNKEKELSDYTVFGQVGGVIFLMIGYSRYITSSKPIPLVSYVLLTVGLYLFTSGVMCPQSIRWFYKGFSFVGNRIGQYIFSVLLTIAYVLLIIPIGIIMKRKKTDYLYISWDNWYNSDRISSGFKDWQEVSYKSRSGILGTFASIINIFVVNGHAFLVPVVVLLVAIGIVLFFVSSSVMAPFIYTLF